MYCSNSAVVIRRAMSVTIPTLTARTRTNAAMIFQNKLSLMLDP